MKKFPVSAFLALSLTGCVGAWVDTTSKTTSKSSAHDQLTSYGEKPLITRSEKSPSTREWCGTTLLVVIIPIPLKLPVCESYSEIAYGKNVYGVEKPLLYTSQSMTSTFYACGPFMFMAPLMHRYQGNALCGAIP